MTTRIQFISVLITCFLFQSITFAQQPATYSSAEIYLQLKKLNVLGSVLYVGAHPDDENNGLLPFLAKEKFYRTAYLSLTRGDGGQNLIGSEQGVELGLIRTQELLAARKMDGAEQYFTRAYEFGFSKSSEEALRIWGHDKILSDVVWVIRQYQPDIIIKRFPPDSRAGHGHHSASAILADEAFTAAADPTKFPEQFNYGVKPWQAKRILWNTYNFGGNNTTSPDQLKIEVGEYNPILGKSYGEIGGEARTMHKSQGEGRPRRKGEIIEFFKNTGGAPATKTLMDDIDIEWTRIAGGEKVKAMVNEIIANYKFENPASSVPMLVKLYNAIAALPQNNWTKLKLDETREMIIACSGLIIEATTNKENVVQGDTLPVTFFMNKRGNVEASVKKIRLEKFDTAFKVELATNKNVSFGKQLLVPSDKKITQPYWLEFPMQDGAFDVRDQQLIGKAENEPPFQAEFTLMIEGLELKINCPVLYKVVDLVKGELYQPLAVLPKLELQYAKDNIISLNGKEAPATIIAKDNAPDTATFGITQKFPGSWSAGHRELSFQSKGNSTIYFPNAFKPNNGVAKTEVTAQTIDGKYDSYTRIIAYDHIPTITYFPKAKANLVKLDIKTVGKKIGYIAGAGDKLPEALQQLGYDVTTLTEDDLVVENLKQYDAIVIGIRAFNIHEYLTAKNDVLNQYVYNGGNLLSQYIKTNNVGLKSVKAGPYPFTISGGLRVTEEDAEVKFLLPEHKVLNYPNKITAADFEGWVQERSTYQGDKIDARYERPLAMHDTNEKETDGSLLIASYGKGNFAYVSLVMFRQLPAGVPGAYRLLANLLALNSQPKGKKK